MDNRYIGDYYVRDYLIPTKLRQVVANCVGYLRCWNLAANFDTIAFRGMSGALVAPMVAMQLDKELIMVRKGESTHSLFQTEGNAAARNVLIIDDFVVSGATVKAIYDGVQTLTNKRANVIGCLEYRHLDTETYDKGYLAPLAPYI